MVLLTESQNAVDPLSSETEWIESGILLFTKRVCSLLCRCRQSSAKWLCGCWRVRHDFHLMSLGNHETTGWWLIFELESTPCKSKFTPSSWCSGPPLADAVLTTGLTSEPCRQLSHLSVAVCCVHGLPRVCSLYDTGMDAAVCPHSFSPRSVLPFAFGQCPRVIWESSVPFLSITLSSVIVFSQSVYVPKEGLGSGPLSLSSLSWAQRDLEQTKPELQFQFPHLWEWDWTLEKLMSGILFCFQESSTQTL